MSTPYYNGPGCCDSGKQFRPSEADLRQREATLAAMLALPPMSEEASELWDSGVGLDCNTIEEAREAKRLHDLEWAECEKELAAMDGEPQVIYELDMEALERGELQGRPCGVVTMGGADERLLF